MRSQSEFLLYLLQGTVGENHSCSLVKTLHVNTSGITEYDKSILTGEILGHLFTGKHLLHPELMKC